MDPRIETLQRDWRFRSCEPGYAGLHALAEAEFSGSITAEDAEGYMVNGRLVGIRNGTIESFWSSDVSALEANDPALPLLCAMLIADSSVEGEYYTGETSISTVDETLSSGSFTGFLELSENVFSGDYFVLYYGGTSRSVAILGTEDRVMTGTEALERANDEVGIFEVNSVTIDVIEIPEPEVDESGGDEAAESEGSEELAASTTEDDPVEEPPAETDQQEVTAEPETPAVEERPEREPSEESGVTPGDPTDIASLAKAAMSGTSIDSSSFDGSSAGAGTDPDEWVTIPTLDPDRTTLLTPPEEAAEAENSAPSTEQTGTPTEPPSEATPEPDEPDEPVPAATEEELADLTDSLEAAERENEQLRERIAELEARLEELDTDVAAGEQALAPDVALDGTNLFVRYQSKANFTLEDAADGSAAPEDVQENLRLEWHTSFEESSVTVDGEPYEEFLQATIEFQFTAWVLKQLLFELRETGGDTGFEDLYSAIPQIDRVEFHGDIPVHTRDGNERSSETFDFDVIFRNGMGDPLMVAAVHDHREPADAETVGQLLADANSVASERNTLRAALFLTRSFFEPEALGTVADATEGSFLRGGSKESYVRVSRKHGFHLCLVEARNETFHLNVPER